MFRSSEFLLTVWAAGSGVTAALKTASSTSTGASTFVLGNGTYYAPAVPIASGCYAIETSDVLPMTLFQTNETLLTDAHLAELVEFYLSTDDVWTEEFLQGAVAISSSSPLELDASAFQWLEDAGAKVIISNQDVGSKQTELKVVQSHAVETIQPGPYVLSLAKNKSEVRQAYLLHQDRSEAFLYGVTPVSGSTAYAPVEAFVPMSQDAWIPVPSRLYYVNDDRPLAGLRIGLKDIYDLEGVKTGGGSRSYTEAFPAANSTSVSMQKLLDLGAIVVGKTKTSQFAHGADPWQFLDIHYPWNPRGDGYLTAASSSSGSAAAIASYDWLDITIGSDTRGSVRKPAALVGSYGMRPSWGSMNLTGVIPLADEMDTAGFFARDPVLFHKISTLWFQDSPIPINTTFTSMPKKLLYPVDYFPLQNPAAQELYESFMSVLEEEFGIVRTPINFTATLRESVENPSIANLTAFQLSSNRLAEYISYQKVGLPLTEAWNAMFPGAGSPPLDPNPRNAFARSVNLTEDDYQTAVDIKDEFQDFFLDEILRPDAETCSESLMILDMGTGGLPSYREQTLNSLPGATSLTITQPGTGQTMPSNYLASMSGCPQIGIPISQVTYQSYISLQEEFMPVNVDLVAARGCDGLLLKILERLQEIGVAKTVRTGRKAF